MCRDNFNDLRKLSFYVAIVAEYAGTLFLVLVGCGAAEGVKASNLHIALTFGLAVATIVWAIAYKSGGHINPAVSLGFMVTRRISMARGILYMAAQTAGAITGALLLKVLTPTNSNEVKQTLGALSLGQGISAVQGFFIESIITFVLVFVVFSAVDSQRWDIGGSVPLTIGLTIAMCHLWAIPFTGSGMNPARSFGPALIAGKWDNHWIYWVGPLVGGALGGILYDFVFAVNACPAKIKAFFTRSDYDNDKFTCERSATDVTEMKP